MNMKLTIRGKTLRSQWAPEELGNSLLAAVSPAQYQRLFASAEPVALKFGEVVQEPGVPIRYVYFPIDCVIALLTPVKGHPDLGIALVGHEGMVGIPQALGIEFSPRRALVQGAGIAMRMEAAHFRRASLKSISLRQALYRFKHALVEQIGQLAACMQFHTVQARLARYLLMTADHTNSMEIPLTQEFVAGMLGVQRPAVTHASTAMEKDGLIRVGRGKMTILDRTRLGAASCDCYKIIKSIYASMYLHG
jgi:CRP-like cAMP-binding protein